MGIFVGSSGDDTLTGTPDGDTIDGGEGNDRIDAGAGDDVLIGGPGNDVLIGGPGQDQMDGGDGGDTFYVDSPLDQVSDTGTGGSDRIAAAASFTLAAGAQIEVLEAITLAETHPFNLTGNDFANLIIGNDGSNTLYGRGGADALVGLGGNDTIDGGLGDDYLEGGLGNDVFFVDAADLVVELANGGTDRVVANASYVLAQAAEVEILETGSVGGSQHINLTGSDFGNTIHGNDGNNQLYGRNGDDRLHGYAGDDWLVGGEGRDTFFGGAGNDRMAGEAGDDLYYVDDAGDVVVEAAGQGYDRLVPLVSYTLSADAEVELIETANALAVVDIHIGGSDYANAIHGNGGSNVLSGRSGNDTLNGYSGNDVLNGGPGADTMIGHNGNDTYYVDDPGDQVIETFFGGNGDADRVASSISYVVTGEVEQIEAITLTALDPIDLAGGAGGNRIVGNNGPNMLDGGAGNDWLLGLGGADVFAFTLGYEANEAFYRPGVDLIEDFLPGTDKVGLASTVFTAISPGALQAGAFHSGSAASDADDRIIYNPATGELLYDADGTGATEALLFAYLASGLALGGADFVLLDPAGEGAWDY